MGLFTSRRWATGLMRGLGGVCAAGIVALAAPRARACGGCFAPQAQTSPSFVTGHRMAFAVSETRTVLWDQFQYDGAPEDFSWVLPVRPGAYLEQARDAWFDSLEAVTATQVTSPQLTCASSGFSQDGCGCGSSSESSDMAGGGGMGGTTVQIVHQGTIGPYETVTLRSADSEALRSWLVTKGYAIPDEIQPIIDAYVAEGHDFIALRLKPGAGVQQMTPVRVVTPGADFALPLRMVAAGVGSFVAITLYVIGEERYAMPDIPEVTPRLDELRWDWATQSSNYAELRQETLAQNGGKTYITSFARPRAFFEPISKPDGSIATFSPAGAQFTAFSSLAGLYFAQSTNNPSGVPVCGAALEALSSSSLVVEGCDGFRPDPCDPPGPGQLGAKELACDGADDLAAAMIGMHPAKVWLTRLDMNLPSTALDADCVVEPAASQRTIDNWIRATKHDNPPCDPAIFSSGRRRSDVPGGLALTGVLGLIWSLRRLRQPSSPT